MIRPQSAAIAFIGCCTLLLCAFQGSRTTRFLNHATRTSGIIAEAAAHPRIRFETAEGTVVDFVQNGFVSRPQGSMVPVAYDPANPAGTAMVATFWPLWGSALWALPVGLGFTLLPLAGATFQWGRR